MPADKRVLMLLDAYSLFHRAYYALPSFTTAGGQPTGAVYGTASMLIKLLSSEKPDYVAAAFDSPGPTFRHQMYKDYKGTRPPTPDELKAQLPMLHELIECMGLSIYNVPGYEADDIIGTLAKQAEEKGLKVVILTGDKDSLQLVTPNTTAMITRTGISSVTRYDEKTVKDELGIKPDLVVDWKALTGDASDNIPGIPGIGPKTATKLLQEYKTLEDLLNRADEIQSKLGDKIRNYKQQAILSKELATINTKTPVTLNVNECKFSGIATGKLRKLFLRLQFTSLIEEVDKKFGINLFSHIANEDQVQIEVEVCQDVDNLRNKLGVCSGKILLSLLPFDCDPFTVKNAAFSFCRYSGQDTAEVNILPLWDDQTSLVDSTALEELLKTDNIEWATDALKPALHALLRLGVQIGSYHMDDLSIASYLLNPGVGEHNASSIILNYLQEVVHLPTQPNEADQGYWQNIAGEVGKVQKKLLEAEPILFRRLKEEDLYRLYQELELPLAKVLARMECVGIALDDRILMDFSKDLSEKIRNYTEAIYDLAGKEFNINSPKQLAEVLFTDLGLPVLKKTKTGPSTDAEVLDELSSQHSIVAKILEYREVVKLKNTYVDALPALMNPQTKRVHTTFCQTVTATGRLSSINPNLQNIPVRTNLGRQIRRAFIAGNPDYVLLAADYSQIELRILAHMSNDENLINAFIAGKDIHRATASEIFDVPLTLVDDRMRTSAKAINFGIVYGMSSYGLAKDTGLTRQAAQQYIDAYFHKYPGVKKYMGECVQQAKERGYALTIMGRKRWIPELNSKNFPRRSAAERTAINSPIQGSAADIIKKAMISVDNALKKKPHLDARLVLQIHDELIYEVRKDQTEQVALMVKEEMEGVYPISVPLSVEIKIGKNWLDAKGWNYA
jgi:DNA polymerase-1